MRKSIFVTLLFLFTFFCQTQSKADFYGGGGFGFVGAGGYYGAAPFTPNAVWGGGYNLNSLLGGGWGGFPAGYGPPMGFYGGGVPFPQAVAPQPAYSGGCPGGGGALTGGFGGYYSPYIRGY